MAPLVAITTRHNLCLHGKVPYKVAVQAMMVPRLALENHVSSHAVHMQGREQRVCALAMAKNVKM